MQNGTEKTIQTIGGKNKLTWLWEHGKELYGNKWTGSWGDYPSEIKSRLLSKLTADEIKQGLADCVKRAQNGNGFPPSPVDFISIAKLGGIDIEGSFARFIQRDEPKDLAEKRTRAQVGFNCRALSYDKAFKMWSVSYRDSFSLLKQGKLQGCGEARALTEHTEAKLTDTMRDNFKPSGYKAAKIMDRVNKIKNK